jgi:hypothetical protein
MARQDARQQRGAYASLNFSRAADPRFSSSGYVFGFSQRQGSASDQTEVFPLAGITNVFTREGHMGQGSVGGAFRAQYQPSDKWRIRYKGQAFLTRDDAQHIGASLLSDVSFNDSLFTQGRQVSLGQELAFTATLNKQYQLSGQAYHQLQSDAIIRRVAASSPLPFAQALWGSAINAAQQRNRDAMQEYGGTLRLRWAKQQLTLDHSASWTGRQMATTFGAITPLSEPEASYRRSGWWAQWMTQAGYVVGRFSLKAGVLGQYLRRVELVPAAQRPVWRWNPAAEMSWSSRNQLFRVQAGLNAQAEMAGFTLGQGALRLGTLNQIYRFAQEQQSVDSATSASLLLSRFNPLAGATWFAFSRYHRAPVIAVQPDFFVGFVRNTELLTPPQVMWMHGFLYDKRIYPLPLAFRASLMGARQARYAFEGERPVKNYDTFWIGGVSFFSTRDSAVNFRLDGQYKIGRHQIGGLSLSGLELQTTASVNGFAARRRLAWNLGLAYVYEAQATTDLHYFNLHGRAGWHLPWPRWTLEMVFNDVLNMGQPTRLSFSRTANALITNRDALFPGFVTANLNFAF